MGPQTDTAGRPQRSLLRRILWAIVIVGGAMILLNALLPDLDFSTQDRVALIRIEGVILDAQATISELKHYSDNPLVKAIVLRIDSPGGGVVPSQEIHDAVKRVKNKSNKAIIASMGTVAASGGYYIAAATDRIIANPGSLTGSIGVIMEMANFEGLMKKVGVELTPSFSAPWVRTFSIDSRTFWSFRQVSKLSWVKPACLAIQCGCWPTMAALSLAPPQLLPWASTPKMKRSSIAFSSAEAT